MLCGSVTVIYVPLPLRVTVATVDGTNTTVVVAVKGLDDAAVIGPVTDADSDGKPDFIVQAGGQEVLLLSSQARPGLTPPAAVLAGVNEQPQDFRMVVCLPLSNDCLPLNQ